ncbi:MAG: AMP-binding protein, partial [Chloroflexota bacterium]
MDSLVDLVRESTARFAERDAYLFKPGIRTQRYRFSDVWEISGRVAGYLRSRGIDQGDRVLFWAPNTPEWPLAFLGCLRLGAVAVPLDVRSTPEFVNNIAAQTQPKLACVSRFTPGRESLTGVPILDLNDLRTAVAGASPTPAPVKLTHDDLAEVMFTSGTTGNPKGVMLSHGNILANVDQSKDMLPGDFHHQTLSLLPLSHMLEQTGGLFVGLLHGATVTFPVSRQPAILIKTMAERHITTMLVVPQALVLFMNAIERELARAGREAMWRRMQDLAGHLPLEARRWLFRPVLARFGGALRYMACGGAYLDPAVGEKWERMGVLILQGYGATEASPVIANNTHREHRLDALGKVVPGLELRIAGDGEILVRGPNITRGYWNNEEATRAAFEDGWYKTGDLGQVDAQGWLYFKGRKKDLIVLSNGQNVFPEDIENALKRQPGVKEAPVVGLDREGGAVEVHAVLLLEAGTDAAAVVRAANRELASHQQVQGFTVWPHDDLPRTHTLKVKKHELL